MLFSFTSIAVTILSLVIRNELSPFLLLAYMLIVEHGSAALMPNLITFNNQMYFCGWIILATFSFDFVLDMAFRLGLGRGPIRTGSPSQAQTTLRS